MRAPLLLGVALWAGCAELPDFYAPTLEPPPKPSLGQTHRVDAIRRASALALEGNTGWALDVAEDPPMLVRFLLESGATTGQAPLTDARPTALAKLPDGALVIATEAGIIRINDGAQATVDPDVAVFGIAAAGDAVWTSEGEHLVRRALDLTVVERVEPFGDYAPGQLAVVGDLLFINSPLADSSEVRVRDLTRPGLPRLADMRLGYGDAVGLASEGDRLFVLVDDDPRVQEFTLE